MDGVATKSWQDEIHAGDILDSAETKSWLNEILSAKAKNDEQRQQMT
jgi:hypothetical protein